MLLFMETVVAGGGPPRGLGDDTHALIRPPSRLPPPPPTLQSCGRSIPQPPSPPLFPLSFLNSSTNTERGMQF
jgi:hypothetical protein